MAAYAEGDIADGPDGQTAVFTGGKWVVQGSPQMPVPAGDDAALNELKSQANDTAWLAQKAQQFKGVQESRYRGIFGSTSPVQSGPMFGDVGIPHIAENINPIPDLVGASDPRIAELESITNQAWAHMRPTGSGGLKAPEIEGFQQAFPSIDHWGRVNNGIADRLQADADTAANKLKYIDNFIRQGQGTFADANAAWQHRGSAVPAPVDSSKPLPNGPAPGSVVDGYRFMGGNPADPASWSALNVTPTELK